MHASQGSSCLLLPIVGYHFYHAVPIPVALTYLVGVVSIMFMMHWHLVKKHGFPVRLCLSWVLYCCLLLLVLVKWW